MPSNELIKKAGDLAPVIERPTFLQGLENSREGTEGLSRIVRPSFVKIVQKNSSDELTEKFGANTIILTPDMIPLTSPVEGTTAKFVPLMFYTEYCKWAPMLLKGVEPMIVERSFDPNSEVGRKSDSPATWSERHPQHADDPRYNYRYCEHLNYIIKLVSDDLMQTEPCLVSFVKTGYKTGQRLGKLALSLNLPLYAGVYNLGVQSAENQSGAWKIYSVDANEETPFVASKEMFTAFKTLHEHYKQLVKDQMVRADYDIDVVGGDREVVRGTNY